MNSKKIIYMFIFIFVSLGALYLVGIKLFKPINSSSIETFIISSGSKGGNYFQIAENLQEQLNKINPNQFHFKNIPSSGSIENISKLKERYADFALIQRDILIKNFYGEGDNIKNITVISPLFQEKFLIYTHEKKNISIEEFKNSLKTSQDQLRIGVTSKDSASYKTFIDIANLLSISLEKIEVVENEYTTLIEDFNNKNIDYLISFSLPIKEFENQGVNFVYFSTKDIFYLLSRMRYFSEATISNDSEYRTLGVWALFVGLDSSVEKIGSQRLIKQIFNDSNTSSIQKKLKSTINQFKNSSSMFEKYLSTLPVAPEFNKVINNSNLTLGFVIAGIILTTLLIAYFYKGNLKSTKKQLRFIWIRYNHILIGIFAVIVSYILCIEYLIYNEEVLFNATGIKSRVLDLTRTDLHIWNVIRMFSQIDDGIFPYSLSGKLVTALSTYLTLFGTIAIAASEYGVHKLTAKRREGRMKIEYQNHIIICGWNNNTQELIEDIFSAAEEYHGKRINIVCVVFDPESILKSNELVNEFEKIGKVTFVKGDIRNKDVVIQCNASYASAIILTAEDETRSADEKTLLRVLSVTKFNRVRGEQLEASNQTNLGAFTAYKTKSDINSTYIVAEVNNQEFVEDLKNAGVDSIVNKGQVTKNILIQSLLNPGVSVLLNNILSFSEDTNEFYTLNLREDKNKHLRNKTFDELVLPLRLERILLVAIKVIYLDTSGKEIIDSEELEVLLKSDGLKRQILTNPINDIETARKTDDDDQLIVLAPTMALLEKGVSRVKF